jgi:endonuclease G
MDISERAARLKSMLLQVTEGKGLETVTRPQPADIPTESLEGFFSPVEDIETSLGKLEEDKEDQITATELFALEAIVMPRERPVVFVRSGEYDPIEEPWIHLNEPAKRSRLTPLLRSIGRVEVPSAPWLPFGGTGFVVGKNLLMTNRHVAKLFVEGAGIGTRLHYQSGDAAVDFKREVDTRTDDRSAYLTVQKVVMVHPYWDMALLQIEGLDDYVPLSLSVRPPDALVGTEVIAVGYPARDDRNDLALQDRIFSRQYNVKRVQPGKLRQRVQVPSFENTVNALTHDSSTLGGNSGSAIIDVQTGEVLGLHFAGKYLKANYAVPTYELARDKFITTHKLNFAGSLTPTNDWAAAWQRVGALEGTATPRQPGSSSPATTGSTAERDARPQAPGNSGSSLTIPPKTMSVTVPVRITVSIGDESPEIATALVEAPQAQIPIIFGNLENRKGYQANFLNLGDGEQVPLPTLTATGKSIAAKLEDNSYELKYHKFSVVVHKVRRLALFTAANVDWRKSSKEINGQKPSRKELTGLEDGVAEQWVTDSRIPGHHQLPDVFFTKDGGAFDKGHLIRRDDVCWGKTFKDIQKANGDTYHTTNCSPQVMGFNRSANGVDNWGDLENLVQAQTKTEKAVLFSGPVLAEDDPLFEGRDEHGKILVRIPQRFWKIIVVKGTSGPEAYGFVLEQDLSNVPVVEEFAVPDRWRVFMQSIESIEEELQGLAELNWLRQFDQFSTDEGTQIVSRLPKL